MQTIITAKTTQKFKIKQVRVVDIPYFRLALKGGGAVLNDFDGWL